MQDNIPDALITAFERQYDSSWNDPQLRNERLAMRYGWAAAMEAKQCLHQIQEPAPVPAAPAAVAVPDGGTPGPWRVRKREKDGQVLGCFVTAPDCQGRAYDADILGDDYDTMERKLADCELIVTAVNAYRAALAATPAAEQMRPCWLLVGKRIDFPHEEVDALAITRYKVVDADKSMFWESAVVAGDGTRQLYTGRKVECENMARKFAGAFAEGAFVFHAMNAPQAQADARDAEQERWMGIGKAIERACVDLPAGAEINIHLEKDAGTVTLSDCDGDEQENFPTDEGFAGVVNAAIDAAIAAAKGE